MKIFIYISIIFLCSIPVSAVDDAKGWSVFIPPFDRSLTGAPDGADTAIELMLYEKNYGHGTFGPIVIWKKDEQSHPLQITNNLGALSSAVRELASNKPVAAQRNIIENCIGVYVRNNGSSILAEYEYDMVIEGLEKSGKNALIKKIKAEINKSDAIKWKIDGDQWELRFYSVMVDKSLIRHTFKGTLKPFASVTSLQSEVLWQPTTESRTTRGGGLSHSPLKTTGTTSKTDKTD